MFLADGTDLWGVAIPGWIGAIGTVGASIIAVIGLLLGRGARQGVKQLAEDSNRNVNNGADQDRRNVGEVHAVLPLIQGDISGDNEPEPERATSLGVTWRLEQRPNQRWLLINTSPTKALIINVQCSDNIDVTIEATLPADVPPGAAFAFTAHRKLGLNPVASLYIDWTVADGSSDSATFYLL
ncbi:hypothetical protein [Humibacter sp. RRB41]|uniref:hypothetical protein n=1 Tax=Humibacter sp. RRB41 TaxID=2919946 RepID=UPI001FA99C3E|nr:hypothetical protein [Humibacter sp. RRB41]